MNRMIRMNNYISIKDLEVFANHGVFEAEKQLGQKFLFSAEIYTDFCGAVRTDDISLSVDYGEVCKKIVEFNKNNSFRLIETAADKTAAMILREFPLIQKIRIEIKKPWVSATARKALAVKKRAKREPRIGTSKRKRLKTTQTAIDPMPRM